MSPNRPLLVRFFSKLVLDILPAALASVIGGLLFSHYDWSQIRARAPVAVRAAPASVEMMQLVRDEHAAVASYLKAQLTAEKDRLEAEDAAAAAEAAGNPATTAAAAVPGGATVAAVESKPLAPPVQEPARVQTTAAAPAMPSLPMPLVIAQAEPGDGALPPADHPNPLLAATINVKDHVVATTQHAFAVIGGIPSWIIALGGRIGGQGAGSSPTGRFVGEPG
jgi:hypothetical protein